ncbi:MAG: hypothetical protein WKF75_18735 [Singulisphaera sp.]
MPRNLEHLPDDDGSPKLIAHNWNWGVKGPYIYQDSIGPDRFAAPRFNPTANTFVWLGLPSFVDAEGWLGKYTRLNPDFAVPAPTYPDGRPATGSNGPAADPRNARLYDALAAKSINGELSVEYVASDRDPDPRQHMGRILAGWGSRSTSAT